MYCYALSLVATTDASVALKNSAQFSRLNHTAMGERSALWNSGSRPSQLTRSLMYVAVVYQHLVPPDGTRCLTASRVYSRSEILSKLMSKLKLLSFKEIELEFLDENCQTLEPIAIALDRLQGEKNSLYADLVPTPIKISSHLSTLHSVNLRRCLPLLNAVTSGFNHGFTDFLQLNPEVNMAILATITHPYFKIRWLPQSLNGQRNRLYSFCVNC
jgi:hypothetical protein